MTPLILALALAASPTAVQPSNPETAVAACAALMNHAVGPGGVVFKKLNELPPGAAEHAVWRTVAGCPVREVVHQGRTYYLDPAVPRLDNRPLTGDRLTRRYSVEPIAPKTPDPETAP